MLRRIVELVVTFVLVAATVALVTAQQPAGLPRSTRVTPSIDVKLVCLPGPDGGDAYLEAAGSLATLGEEPDAVGEPQVLTDIETPIVATGTSAIIGGVHSQDGSVASWSPCSPAVAQGMLVLPGTAGTDLLIANSDPTDASVDLTLFGPEGEITAVGARGIAVAPGTTRVIALSVLADVESVVGVRMSTSRGRVTVAARTVTDGLADVAVLAAPDDEHYLAGIPTGVTTATLVLSNPGTERVEAEVSAFGETARYTPEGGQSISIPARSTISVDLGASLAGEATGLAVSADGDIAVGLATGTGADQAFAGPAALGTELAAFGPGGGSLQVSNPSGSEATLTLDGAEHTVPAGTTVAIELPADATPVTVSSTVEVFGAVVHAGDEGVFAVDLQQAGSLAAEPIDAELEPTLR